MKHRSYSHKHKYSAGFALPTILIASVVMIIVLLAAIQASVSINTALNSQYNDKLTQEAAESGVTFAQECLDKSYQVATWTDSEPLKPNTDCNGDVVPSVSAYVLDTTMAKTTFEVPAPTTITGAQSINSKGTLSIMRASAPSGSPVRTQVKDLTYLSGRLLTFRNVGFGYSYSTTYKGTRFGVVIPTGEVKMVGYNAEGGLGDGTLVSRTTPINFGLPAGLKGSRIFTNFLSVGYAMYVVTTTGDVYAAGANPNGMLGVGNATNPRSTPAKVVLPAGVTAKFIGSQVAAAFVIGSDNNVYSTGQCALGQLGSNYTIAGCTDRLSANVRVNLPAVNINDPNTLPVNDSDWVQATNMANDRYNTFLRMQGGRVYGWGDNNGGQLADGTLVAKSSPVKMGVFGDAGQPKATQVAFDGGAVYVLDDAGNAYAAGDNSFGKIAGGGATLMSGATGFCMNNAGTVTVNSQVTVATCNDASINQQMMWMSDSTIRVRPSSSVEYCLAQTGGGAPIRTAVCNPALAQQQWKYFDDTSIRNGPGYSGCMTTPNPAVNGSGLFFSTCQATPPANQQWVFQDAKTLRKVPIPASAGTVTRITTDNSSVLFLTSSGQVWGAGSNARGMLGNGEIRQYNPALVRYGGTSAVSSSTVVDFYTTTADATAAVGSQYNNTYVILSNGSVYGSGSNVFGQLGQGLDGSGNDITSATEATPVKMALPTEVKARSIQVGFGTTIFLSTTGDVYTVGNNSNGQLGDGTTTSSSVPEARKYVNPIKPVIY